MIKYFKTTSNNIMYYRVGYSRIVFLHSFVTTYGQIGTKEMKHIVAEFQLKQL